MSHSGFGHRNSRTFPFKINSSKCLFKHSLQYKCPHPNDCSYVIHSHSLCPFVRVFGVRMYGVCVCVCVCMRICGFQTEKSEGCNHMTCVSCQSQVLFSFCCFYFIFIFYFVFVLFFFDFFVFKWIHLFMVWLVVLVVCVCVCVCVYEDLCTLGLYVVCIHWVCIFVCVFCVWCGIVESYGKRKWKLLSFFR